MTHAGDAELLEQMRSFIRGKATLQMARDPVNQAAIRNWCCLASARGLF